jgi:type II secretory pathway component GspD/PulD (secretin)
LVDNGQTVVLGGLRKKDVSKVINKIPLLGDVPIICYLFRFEGEDTINSEMVVFITPRIIENPALSEVEQQQFKITEFNEPQVNYTRAEKSGE